MPILLDNALIAASTEIDRVRNDLRYIHAVGARVSSIQRDRNANVIAASYVWLAASIERFVKSNLVGIITEINSSGVVYNRLKPCLFSLVCSPEFDSLQNLRGLKMHVKRVEVYARLDHLSAVSLNLAKLPLDKGTIKPEHLETMWTVLDISGSSIPTPKHRLALLDLADGRNKVAHGEVNPIAFGRSKAMTDVLNLVEYIEEIILHVNMASVDYLRNRQYER